MGALRGRRHVGERSRMRGAVRSTALAGTAVAVAALAPQAYAASAPTPAPAPIRSITVPSSLTLGVTDVKWPTVSAVIDMPPSDDYRAAAYFWREDNSCLLPATDFMQRQPGGMWTTRIIAAPDLLENTCAGVWTAYVQTQHVDVEEPLDAATKAISIRRDSRITRTNAWPEAVRAGGTVTVHGRLTRANWETGRYQSYGGRTVQLQFRSPNGSYATVKTVTGGPDGVLRTTARQPRSGCWRFHFPGSRTTAPEKSRGDCIDVSSN